MSTNPHCPTCGPQAVPVDEVYQATSAEVARLQARPFPIEEAAGCLPRGVLGWGVEPPPVFVDEQRAAQRPSTLGEIHTVYQATTAPGATISVGIAAPTLLARLEKKLARQVEVRYQRKVNALRNKLEVALAPAGPCSFEHLHAQGEAIDAMIDGQRERMQYEAEAETLDALANAAGAMQEP